MQQAGKVDRQPAYVLHAQPYRETSLLLEVMTPQYGRFALVARGARRPRSDLRGLLMPFQPLTLSWFGKNEVRTLHVADWQGGVPQLSGLPLICGFYLNELLLKLTPREDAQADTWLAYDTAIRALGRGEALAGVLRRFELMLLSCLGYVPDLAVDVAGEAVEAGRTYLCPPGSPPRASETGSVRGAVLLAMAGDDWSDPRTRREARPVLRAWLDEVLGGERLATRELLMDLMARSE